jgi:peptidoglycan/xylan/chitin deacetylase (PgdA/CDA1 family)
MRLFALATTVLPIFLALQSMATTHSKVALTFDDLPMHASVPDGQTRAEVIAHIIHVLKAEKIPSPIVFANLASTEVQKENQDIVKAWSDSGFLIGNHNYTHRSLKVLSLDDYIADFKKNEKRIKELTGHSFEKYFRYPYQEEGDTFEKRDGFRAFLKKEKYEIAPVTIDFDDWAWNEPYARCKNQKNDAEIFFLKQTYLDEALRHLDLSTKKAHEVFGRNISHVMLIHVGAFDSVMLQELIQKMRKQNVEFVSLKEALKDKAYRRDGRIIAMEGITFIEQVQKSNTPTLVTNSMLTYPKQKLETLCPAKKN